MEATLKTLAFLAVIGLALFFTFLIWLLWCWVMPQLFAGPPQLVAPGFWLFAGCWFLLGMVVRVLRGG